MKFSIIIPLYNKAPYVARTIESVLVQTYSDWELIIMDDGSTDDGSEVVRDCVERKDVSSRVHLYTQTNAGVSAARNHAVELSKGDYLCFLDADDWWEPNYLEELDKLISSYPDAGLYFTNYIYYKPGKTRVMLTLPTGYINYPQAYYQQGAMLATSSSSMPRYVFGKMGGFPIGICLGEDFMLWARTAMQYKVAYLDKALVYFNNDVPPSLRATHHLYPPQTNMLFHLDELNPHEMGVKDISESDWQRLFDRFRVGGLMEYWMQSEYHDMAKQELQKVDWSQQPYSVKRRYRIPITLLRLYYAILHLASQCKQLIRSFIYRK